MAIPLRIKMEGLKLPRFVVGVDVARLVVYRAGGASQIATPMW